MNLNLDTPDHTTLSRRSQRLDLILRRVPAQGPLHLVVDSTGLSVLGEGEWAAAKHGKQSGDFSRLIEVFRLRQESVEDRGISVGLRRNNAGGPPILALGPHDLIYGLWLQLAQTVTSNTKLRRCAWCSTWFSFGTGTGRRKSAHYCSDKCRKAAFRHRKAILSLG